MFASGACPIQAPDNLLLWIEPWAEEFEVPPRSSISLSMSDGSPDSMFGEVEWTEGHLVFWASEPGTVRVFVDGALRELLSALVPIPEEMTKRMLNIVFAGQPAARLGGRRFDAAGRTSWWQRVRRR